MNRNGRGSGLIAIPIGIILFLAGFPVIWFNEGRVDLSVLAEDSIELVSDQYNPEYDGSLVSLSGEIQTDELIGDPPYLKAQPYIELRRVAEMYAWEESGDDEDGYTYRKEWTTSPENSDNFDSPQGHHNPPMDVNGASFVADAAQIGRFDIEPREIIFGQVEEVDLSEGLVSGGQLSGNYLYLGSSVVPSDPEIGDIRLSYEAYRSNQFTTVFGEQQGERVVLWSDGDGTIIYRGYALNREGGIAALRTEYLTALWGVRFGGLALFFFGLMIAVSPLRRILGYVPILGNVGNFAIALAAFVIAFSVWLVTLIIAIILHNIIVLVIVLALSGIAGYYFYTTRQQKSV